MSLAGIRRSRRARPAGGNIDCKELVSGSTLFLPITVRGALLYLGDGHAAQGDGEVGGTAIECPMTGRSTAGQAGWPGARATLSVGYPPFAPGPRQTKRAQADRPPGA